MIIRRAAGIDYEPIAAVLNAAVPSSEASPSDLRERDDGLRAAGLVWERLVAELEGAVVGSVAFGANEWSADQALWSIHLFVHPEVEGRGFARSLHDQAVRRAVEAGANRLFSRVDDDPPRGRHFAAAAGYVEIGHTFESRLDLADAPPGWVTTFEAAATEHDGVRIVPLASIREDIEDWFERLFGLYAELESDVPSVAPSRPMPVETFRLSHVEGASVVPEGFFIAVQGDRWIGLTEMRRVEANPKTLIQELTGVVRDCRRRGFATRLKRVGLGWAISNGYSSVRTWNDSPNEGMIAVNRQLGFKRIQAARYFLLELPTRREADGG